MVATYPEIDRNPVGSTHEDVDALFGDAKGALDLKDCATPDEMMGILRDRFKDFKLPVVFLEVDATLDYREFYTPHIDKKLEGYGCGMCDGPVHAHLHLVIFQVFAQDERLSHAHVQPDACA